MIDNNYCRILLIYEEFVGGVNNDDMLKTYMYIVPRPCVL